MPGGCTPCCGWSSCCGSPSSTMLVALENAPAGSSTLLPTETGNEDIPPGLSPDSSADYVGWPLPMISLAFDLVQRTKSLKALVKVAQQENEHSGTHHEQCYANTIGWLNMGIGDQHHVCDGNSLTQISDRRAPKKRSD